MKTPQMPMALGRLFLYCSNIWKRGRNHGEALALGPSFGLTAEAFAHGDVPILCWGPGDCRVDIPRLKQDPNTLNIPPDVKIPQVLTGWQTKECPSGAYMHMTHWVCFDWYMTLLASPTRYYGHNIRTEGVVHMTPDGHQLFLMPSRDMNDGPERIRIEGAASSLPPLKDGEPIFVAGTFGPEDAAHAPGLGVLSHAHDVVFYKDYPGALGSESLLPDLRLKTPRTVTTAPPKFAIAPGAR